MGRGKAADAEAVRGACAWACMRREPGYRAAWAAGAGPVRFEAAPFPLRVQTAADFAAAEWGLAVWEDPDVEVWRTPFLPGMPVLFAEPAPSSGAALQGRADRALVSVLDGLGAEKSQRWMAERIWGEARVASEWSSESWMRAQVRRWIPKARALAAGGWRDLVPRHVPEPWRDAPSAGPDA